MNDQSSPPRPWRRALFLLPALLAAALIFYTLPRTQPVLAAVPELLEYVPTPAPEPTEKVDRSAQREEAEAKHADPTAGRKATVASFTAPAAYKDGTYTGSAQGFGGTISVAVTILDGKIADLRVTSASGETEPYFSRAKAVVSRVLSAGTPNVDAVSGATFSSAGILNAAKQALNKAAANPEPTPSPTPAPTPAPSAAPKTTLHDGVYTGVGEGYGGEIVLRLTVENGRVVSAEVTEAEDETPAYYNRAAALLPRIIEQQTADLDAVSGATFSSRGILSAAQSALEQAAADPVPEPIPELTPEPTPEPTPELIPEPAPEPTPAPKLYRDGEYTARGWCEEIGNFRYEVIVTVTVEDGLMCKVAVEIGADESDFPEDNDYFIDRAINGTTKQKGIPDRIVAAQSAEDVDAVSGATYTSQTICRLVTEALRGAEIGGER